MKIKMKSNKIDVLDKGFVEYISHMGSDLMVANAARVSFNKESNWDFIEEEIDGVKTMCPVLSEKDTKLINYLAKHSHWTPFAHPQISLRIKAPIFVRAQLGKHQIGLVMNEVSRRYVTYNPEFYSPKWRSAPTDGAKQGSSGFMNHTNLISETFDNFCEDSLDLYKELLADGVAPEQARAALPQAMYTEWWWTGSLAALARVYAQRIESHAQWEVQEYAKAIGSIVGPLFPVSWKTLTETTK